MFERAARPERRLAIAAFAILVVASVPLPRFASLLPTTVVSVVSRIVALRAYGWYAGLLALALLAGRRSDLRRPLFTVLWQSWLITALASVAVAVGFGYISHHGTGYGWSAHAQVAGLWIKALAIWQGSIAWRTATGRRPDPVDWCLIVAAGLAGSYVTWLAMLDLGQSVFEWMSLGLTHRLAPAPARLAWAVLVLSFAQWLGLQLGRDEGAPIASGRVRLAWAGWCLSMAFMLALLQGWVIRGSLELLLRNLFWLASLAIGPLAALVALVRRPARPARWYDVSALAGFAVAGCLTALTLLAFRTGLAALLFGT